MKNNVLQFKPKEKIKAKRKRKLNYYIGTYKSSTRQIEGFKINKKEFLKDCVSLTKHMLDVHKPETAFTCIKKKFSKKTGYR